MSIASRISGTPTYPREVQEHLDELVLGPVAPRHAQVKRQLTCARRRGIGDDADQGAGLEIEARAGPQGAEDRDLFD